ncbi:MAG: DUF3817 domain-containing protein [Actinomycetota bacterium]|nr:DUF3817 domain-containing protein [Actinomycetota bacterium]MEC8445943.1 DUF3817 domain-containing protein [Actinomycetota bacterium]MEC9213460.1 DUF3817 domain-containing protein [Actinomycetota bacterium]MED5345459.1 DUF3817 domain-containing protein [Actinomycetota bacterium]MED5528189.1 DUF3817 domain-containing protein [Actinomycetota bacterium]
MGKLPGALLRFRVMAYVTGVVLGVLTVWLVIGYGFLDYANTEVKPDLYRWLWTAHGWLYVVYLVAGVDLCFRIKLSVIRTLAVLLAGTIPFMSFVADYQLHKYVRTRGLGPSEQTSDSP